MSYASGLSASRVNPLSYLRQHEDTFIHPLADDDNFVVESTDFSGITNGTALTLSSNCPATRRMQYARSLFATLAADAGGETTSSITLVVKGVRFGEIQTENIAVSAAAGNSGTTNGTKVFDQILSVTPQDKVGDAGDTIILGISGTTAHGAKLGLSRPIDAVTDVHLVLKDAAGTPAVPTAISSSVIDADNSALIVPSNIAVTDIWRVVYTSSANDNAGAQGA